MPGPYDPRIDRICFKILASPLHSPRLVATISDFLRGATARLGFGIARVDLTAATNEEEAREGLSGCHSAFIALATGGTEHLALEALDAMDGKPAVVASQPHANSLSSLMELKPVLPRGTAAVHLPSLDPKDTRGLRRLEEALRGLWAAHKVRGLRLGLIGDPSPWLVHSRPREEALARLGISLVKVAAGDFVKLVRAAGPGQEAEKRLLSRVEVEELAPGEPGKSLRIYEALRRLATDRGLSAVTPACWWFYRDAGANACLAHALLNDEGLVVGCEGDVPSTVAMALASYASGSPAFFANIANIDGDRLLIAHCTAPYSLGRRIRVTRHFITGGSVTSKVEFKPYKEWTVMRLDPGLETLSVFKGETLDTNPGLVMQCESQLLLKVPGAELLLETSSGNHHVAVPGDWRGSLRVAAEILGLKMQDPTAGSRH